ncbi:hypothetical protein KIS4809_0414 [Bacillus sp. ZZV12-4809]|nr:hypothetical protein KIS4809_0414 [Bacillus sp. ZZV12-4809]
MTEDLQQLKILFNEMKNKQLETKYNPTKNPKELILSLIRFSIDELEKEDTRNDLVFNAARMIVSLTHEKSPYFTFLVYTETYKYDHFDPRDIQEKLNNLQVKKNYRKGLLSTSDNLITREIATAISSEYAFLTQGKFPDLLMMKVYYNFLVSVLENQTFTNAAAPSFIDIFIDTNHELLSWNVTDYHVESPTRDTRLFISTHSLDPLENEIERIKNMFGYLSPFSIREIATAISTEKAITKSKELLSYMGLSMSYLGVIESELKTIILHREKENNIKKKSLMWKKIMGYLESRKDQLIKEVELEEWDFWISKLIEFNSIRNRPAHGEPVKR